MVYIISGIVILLAILLVIASILPSEREFNRIAIIEAPLSTVFSTVTNIKAQEKWRNDVKQIKVMDSETWTEIRKKGTPITFKVTDLVKNQLLRIDIIEPKSFNGYWVGKFESVSENQTKVDFTEVVVVNNLFFKIISRLFVHLNKTMDVYMENLKSKVEK